LLTLFLVVQCTGSVTVVYVNILILEIDNQLNKFILYKINNLVKFDTIQSIIAKKILGLLFTNKNVCLSIWKK